MLAHIDGMCAGVRRGDGGFGSRPQIQRGMKMSSREATILLPYQSQLRVRF